jgi:hypothetical protein
MPLFVSSFFWAKIGWGICTACGNPDGEKCFSKVSH